MRRVFWRPNFRICIFSKRQCESSFGPFRVFLLTYMVSFSVYFSGCWWYCFTPSIVREITHMRIEMLGTAFTAQHSDARVLDQYVM
jgi:hypothetical protein